MERVLKFEFEKKEYKLVLMSGTEQDFLEEYELQNIFEIFEISGRKRVKAIIDLVRAMNADAGGEKLALPDDVSPADFAVLQAATLKAIVLGHRRDVEPKEIDEGLAELEKKKDEQPARISWFSRVLGLVCRKRRPTQPRPE